jgi:GNAT superfamily N-acetyltransferase
MWKTLGGFTAQISRFQHILPLSTAQINCSGSDLPFFRKPYVATDAAQTGEPRACLGFYAINAHAIGVADVPFDAARRAPRSNLIPGVLLSHLAVDGRQQGKGLGRILLVDAMQQCQRAGQILGVRLMLLDVAGTAGAAERARLHSFYASMGFRPLPGRPERLFLSLSTLPPL